MIGTVAHLVPVPIGNLSQVVEVDTMHSTRARLNSGQVWCLGLKGLGQFGDGERVSTTTCVNGLACAADPVRAGVITAAALSTTWDNTTALGTDGKIYVWGANTDAQLGHAPGTAGDESCLTSDKCNTSPSVLAVP